MFNLSICSHLSSCTYWIALTLQSLFTTFVTIFSGIEGLFTPGQHCRMLTSTFEAVNRQIDTRLFFWGCLTYSYWGKIERLRYWPVEFSCRMQTRMINVKVATVFMFCDVTGTSWVAPLHHHCLQSRCYIHILWSSWKQPFSLRKASAKITTEKIVSAFDLEKKRKVAQRRGTQWAHVLSPEEHPSHNIGRRYFFWANPESF